MTRKATARIPRTPPRQSLAALSASSEPKAKRKPVIQKTVTVKPANQAPVTFDLPDDPMERLPILQRAADALIGDPMAIAALHEVGVELLQPSSDRRRQVVDLIETKLTQHEGARYAARVDHFVTAGRHQFVIQGVHAYNTPQANAFERVLQRFLEVQVIRHEDPDDASRFGDRTQRQPARHTFGREKRSLG